jgi:hypothetical protein
MSGLRGDIDLSEDRLRYWTRKYEKRVGEPFSYDPVKEKIIWHPLYGVMTWSVVESENAISVNKLVGDGRYWEKVIDGIARFLKKKKVIAYTKRNPGAWHRKYGYRTTGYIIEKTVDDGGEVD